MTLSSIQTISKRLAEEVMGWANVGDKWVDPSVSQEKWLSWFQYWVEEPEESPTSDNYWNPYASIEQAMMVAEKMCQIYNSLELHIWRGSSVDPKAISAQAIFTHEGDKYLENAETPAEAICLAAIKALEG